MPPTGLLSSLEMKYVKRLVEGVSHVLVIDMVVAIAVSVLDRTFSVTCPQELNKTRV